MKEGATALVVCSITGEAPTLTPVEQRELVRIAVAAARGIPVIAGAGSNSTAHAIELTRDAEAAGADAILSVVPYYNKPTQAGLYAHFHAVAQSTGLPIILHDVPTRTVCGIADETIVRLAEMQQFIGLKDCAGDIRRPSRLRPFIGDGFRLLSGDDATALAYLVEGGNGCISIAANVAPGLCRMMFREHRQGQVTKALRLSNSVARLADILCRETNPAPLKFALSLLGLMSPRVRLPLVEVTERTQEEVAAVLAQICDRYEDFMVGKIGTSFRPEAVR